MSANTFMRRPGLVKTKLWGWAGVVVFKLHRQTLTRLGDKAATLKCMLGYIPIFTMRASPVAAAASEASDGSEGSKPRKKLPWPQACRLQLGRPQARIRWRPRVRC